MTTEDPAIARLRDGAATLRAMGMGSIELEVLFDAYDDRGRKIDAALAVPPAFQGVYPHATNLNHEVLAMRAALTTTPEVRIPDDRK